MNISNQVNILFENTLSYQCSLMSTINYKTDETCVEIQNFYCVYGTWTYYPLKSFQKVIVAFILDISIWAHIFKESSVQLGLSWNPKYIFWSIYNESCVYCQLKYFLKELLHRHQALWLSFCSRSLMFFLYGRP